MVVSVHTKVVMMAAGFGGHDSRPESACILMVELTAWAGELDVYSQVKEVKDGDLFLI